MSYALKHIFIPIDWKLSRYIFILAYPVILGNFSRVLMNLVDMVMVGRLGAEAIAATGLGAVLIWVVLSFAVAIRTGVQTITSRRYGEKKFNECGSILHSGILLAGIMGVLFASSGYLLAPKLIGFLTPDPTVKTLAIGYTRWVFLAAFFNLVSFAFQGFYNGLERTQIHMRVSIASNLLNAYLNAGFIFGSEKLLQIFSDWGGGNFQSFYLLWAPFDFPEMGVNGAAFATFLASGWMIVHYALYGLKSEFRKVYESLHISFKPEVIRRMLKLVLPQGLQEIGITAVFILFFKIVGILGTKEVAATNIVFTIMQTSFLPAMGFGVAAATLIGKHLGEKNVERAEVSIIESVRLSVLFMGSIGILFLSIPHILIPIFTDDKSVVEIATPALQVLGIVQFIDAVGMTLWFALSGAGNTTFPAVVEMIIAWGVFLPISYAAVVYFHTDLLGPWSALLIYIVLYAVILTWKILKGDWKEIRV